MKDLTQLETLQITCELLAASVTLREAARTAPVNVAECHHVADWMQTHARANLNMPVVPFSPQPGPITADSIAAEAQQLAYRLLACRDELRKEESDATIVFRILAEASFRIEQLHANVSFGLRLNAA